MKLSLNIRTLLLGSFLCLLVRPVFASHGMGGEITWQCQPSGAFVFKIKFCRDCNGIPAPGNVSLTTIVPGVLSIPMTRIQINYISPRGYFSDGTTSCPSCSIHGGNPGVIEEHIYVSQHVFLNGVPPESGWDFFRGECCRSNILTNIVNPGSVGFRLKATMFPFMGQNTNPCFDSSPYFIEKPNTKVCAGTPVVYHHIAGDIEYDSLAYEFTTPLTESGNPVVFESGYVYQWFYERWAIPGATSHQYAVTQAGTYHVLAVTPDGNGNYSEPYVYNSVGINENNLSNFSVHPNPGNGMVYINSGRTNNADYNISVTDVSGRVILRDAMITPDHQLDLSRFGKGVMMPQVSDESRNRRFEKLIVY